MRLAMILFCAACDGHDAKPPPIKHVDRLEERDRGELIQIAGRATEIYARASSGPPHIRFQLALHRDGRTITVVTKDVVPDLFRDGADVEVVGRWAHAEDVRDALDKEGFTDVRGGDVLLARTIVIAPLEFQF